MRILLVCFSLISFLVGATCQGKTSIYNPNADAKVELNKAIEEANKLNKHVLVQVGGNWCPWCVKMHHFFQEQATVDSLINADYVFLRINYSKENKNLEVLEQLEYPQRFGFPVMVVLDGDGIRLHTQDTGFLEEEGGYSLKKVILFLRAWNIAALDPEAYK
jgi:thioredoxin-related protein